MVAVAPVNEYVVRTSLPDQVDSAGIYFTGLDGGEGHRKATINWLEPGKGDWEWPILGYDVQVTTAATFTDAVTAAEDTDSDGVDDTAPVFGMTTDIDFTGLAACPDGEVGTVGRLVASEGCFLNAVAQNDATTHLLTGLKADTMYFFRIRARNHDGHGDWSAASYGLLTHSVPNVPATPVVLSTEVLLAAGPAITITFDAPGTTGTNACDSADLTNGVRPDAATYLSDQKCTVALATATGVEMAPREGVQGDSDDDRTCSTTDASKSCQTVGSGSGVTGYRILMCKVGTGNDCADPANFIELKDPTTGLSMYPMVDGGGGLLDASAAADFQFTVTQLDAATTYMFKVQATNSAGESGPSTAVSGTTLDVPLKPHPPTATSIGEVTTDGHTEAQITLTWNIEDGYCASAADTEPQPTETYTSLNNPNPNDETRTTTCRYDNGVALTGFRLFASSYSVLGTYDASGGGWEPARRGSLTDDSSGTAYFSSPLDTALPDTLAQSGEWLEIDVTNSGCGDFASCSFVVDKLSQDTYYKFAILFTNAVGDSAVSDASEFFLTLEAPVSDLKMHTSPPCIYESGAPTRFVATSTGTNVFYKWQLPDGIQTNVHDTRSFGSVIAEAGTVVVGGGSPSDPDAPGSGAFNPDADTRCKTTDCSVMEFVLPSISSNDPAYTTPSDTCTVDSDPNTAEVDCATGFTHGDAATCPTGCTYAASQEALFSLAVIGYNTRGQTVLQTSFDIQYCGCTDPWDPAYWDQATYHLPDMCDHEAWDGAEMSVIENEFQYYQTFYYENTHSAQVIVRVDEGSVDLFLSTETVPDAAMDTTYFHTTQAISTWALVEIPYAELEGSTSIYAAVRGVDTFSRFSIITSTREFTRGRGERYTDSGGQVLTRDFSTDLRRTQLKNIEPQAFEIKTPYYDFFEYYFARASNDVDVEIKVNCQLGCVDVFTSKIERFPSALRQTDSYAGYWTSHNGAVCAEESDSPGDDLIATPERGSAQTAQYATASFDGAGGVYGMVTFTQTAPTCTGGDAGGSCASDFAAAADTSEASCIRAEDPDSCTYTNTLSVSVSLKGLTGDYTWMVHAGAVGETSGVDTNVCASTGAIFSTDLPDLLDGTHSSPATIFSNSATISTGGTADTLTLFGESVSSVSDGDADAQSILGRSVVIVKGEQKYCATIYPDSTVTSYVGELSLMHTIRPEETVQTCVSDNGAPDADCSATSERLLFASVQGAQSYAVGAEQVNNEYSIEAKIYRYRVESNLLEPTVALSATGNYISEADSEDRRYSVVTIDNFNYYEVELSDAAYGLSVELTVHYGQVELYTSKDKLPTQDIAGHDNLFGDVHAGLGSDNCPTTCLLVEGETTSDALAANDAYNQFGVGRKYRITIPFADVNVVGKYVFLGILGTAPDSSYEIAVTEYLFHEHMPGHAGVTGVRYPDMLVDDQTVDVSVPPQQYVFFELYVGPQDEIMSVTERSGAGSRTGDLGTDPDTWGIDWSEQLTPTWVEQQQDEWDLDVDVSISVTGNNDLKVFGSSRESFPSVERGSDTDESIVSSSDGNLVIPHFTFSDKLVYISVFNGAALGTSDAAVSIHPLIQEMHLDQLTVDSETTYPACPGTSGSRAAGTLQVCSGHGSCIGSVSAAAGATQEEIAAAAAQNACYCDNSWLGADCSIEAFSSDTVNQPAIVIADDGAACALAITGVAADDQSAACDAASYVYGCSFDDSGDANTCTATPSTTALAGGVEVIVPFDLSNIPTNSKVHVYVDGLPYPAKGANVLYYNALGPSNHAGTIEVYGMAAGVLHTVELLLLSADNIPLGTDMVDFAVEFAGGCANGCSDNGVCHHGYCVCHDGFVGLSCAHPQFDNTGAEIDYGDSFKPGDGFVQYNTAMMTQERDEDAYISRLKLDANTNFLAISDDAIQKAHADVVEKLNNFISDNQNDMEALAAGQAAKAEALHRKRDRITTTIQQMREESRRLKTANTEAYLETVRSLHENQRLMQNELDAKRLQHFQNMAVKHDEWVEIKERNDFKLNQLRTANGPLVNIDDLEERECTQDDMFHTSCVEKPASAGFVEAPGYTSHGTIAGTGTCTAADAANPAYAEAQGYRCVCSTDADGNDTCVQVTVDGEMDATAYHDIPR